MCCARASSRCLSCSARQAWVLQDSWSSTSCCARFAYVGHLSLICFQLCCCSSVLSPCLLLLPYRLLRRESGVVRCLVNRSAASFCCSATCSASVGRACVALHSRHSLRLGPSPRLQSDWQGVHCLRWCSQPLAASCSMTSFRRSKIRAQGFTLLDGGSMQGLGRCNNALRQNGQSLLELVARELSRTLLRLLLTLHGFGNAHVIEFGESLHHSLQLCVHGIPVADQLVSRVLRSGTLLLLVLHVLSMATSCTVSCFRTVSATLDTDYSSVALITVAFSVTACAVSDSTVIVVTEVSASSTTFRLRRV